jgi:hypothetical protein
MNYYVLRQSGKLLNEVQPTDLAPKKTVGSPHIHQSLARAKSPVLPECGIITQFSSNRALIEASCSDLERLFGERKKLVLIVSVIVASIIVTYTTFSISVPSGDAVRFSATVQTETISSAYPLWVGTENENLSLIMNNSARQFNARYGGNCCTVYRMNETALGTAVGVFDIGVTENYSEFVNCAIEYPSVDLTAVEMHDSSLNITFWMVYDGSYVNSQVLLFVQFVQSNLNTGID